MFAIKNNDCFFIVYYTILTLNSLKYIKNNNTYLEREPLETVTKKRQLAAFKYNGFWQCIDTKRDIDQLNKILSVKKKIKF